MTLVLSSLSEIIPPKTTDAYYETVTSSFIWDNDNMSMWTQFSTSVISIYSTRTLEDDWNIPLKENVHDEWTDEWIISKCPILMLINWSTTWFGLTSWEWWNLWCTAWSAGRLYDAQGSVRRHNRTVAFNCQRWRNGYKSPWQIVECRQGLTLCESQSYHTIYPQNTVQMFLQKKMQKYWYWSTGMKSRCVNHTSQCWFV